MRVVTLTGGTAMMSIWLSQTDDAAGLYRIGSISATSTVTGNGLAAIDSLYTDVQPGMNTRYLKIAGYFLGGSTGAEVILMGLHQIVRLSH